MIMKLIENENTGIIVSQQTVKQFEIEGDNGVIFLARIVDNGDSYKFITNITGEWDDVESQSDLYDLISEECYGIW